LLNARCGIRHARFDIRTNLAVVLEAGRPPFGPTESLGIRCGRTTRHLDRDAEFLIALPEKVQIPEPRHSHAKFD
jgi:hypothetical protein